jgi:hypothetical protein
MFRNKLHRLRILLLFPLFIFGVISILATSGSNPVTITSFSVNPKKVCPGTPINIAWNVTGATSATLVRVPGDRTPLSSSSGTRSEPAPASDTRYTLEAGTAPARSLVETVEVIPPGSSKIFTLTVLGACSGATPIWRLVVAPAEWDEANIRIERVVNFSVGVPGVTGINIEHGGVVVSNLALARETTAFNDTRVSGDWIISPSTPIFPNPCGTTTSGGAPPPLTIQITVRCR